MTDFSDWTHQMATKALPGGVAAAAVSAAMGAALIAKAARVSLRRRSAGAPGRDRFSELLEAAEGARTTLLDLSAADTLAYRALLSSQSLAPGDPARQRVVAEASDVPRRVAATCQTLIDRSQPLVDDCWPAVRPDVEIGCWMLEVAVRAGSLAAAENLRQEEHS